jgi:hypothetical protein
LAVAEQAQKVGEGRYSYKSNTKIFFNKRLIKHEFCIHQILF